jgi:hypothetical protein
LTPFEETLAAMPEEEVPADLQDRCLAALDEVRVAQPKRAPMALWRQFAVAACASIVIAIALSPIFLNMGHDQSQPIMSASGRDKAAAGPAAPAAPPATDAMADNWRSKNGLAPNQHRDRIIAGGGSLHEEPMPGGPPAAGAPVAQRRVGRAFAPVYSSEGDQFALRGDEVMDKVAPPAGPERQPTSRSVVPPPADPWYDRSPDRQKISRREMQVETPDVESAYREAIGIIEKAKGYVADEELLLQEDDSDTAHIAARIPSDGFDGVLTQLRGIGKLVKMSGRSEDRTQEYKTRGADIRALSLTEQDLVARYERERNATRKSVLREELNSLRRQLQRDKQMLLDLAAETSFAYLDLSIAESGGVWHKLSKASHRSVPLAMAGGALIMLPFLIVALLWKRR